LLGVEAGRVGLASVSPLSENTFRCAKRPLAETAMDGHDRKWPDGDTAAEMAGFEIYAESAGVDAFARRRSTTPAGIAL